MGWNLTHQTKWRLINTVYNASEDATIIEQAAKQTVAYRLATLEAKSIRLSEKTAGVFLHVTCEVDGDTGTLEIWGYAEDGDAEYIGSYTYVADAMVATDGGYAVDAFTEVSEGHSCAPINVSDGMALIKFDTVGLLYIVVLINSITSSNAASRHNVYMRVWA